jgi:hypothetical protein
LIPAFTEGAIRKLLLLFLESQNPRFDCVFDTQFDYFDGLGLTYTPGSVDSLSRGRIGPGVIEKDDLVGAREIQSDTSGLRTATRNQRPT